MSAPRPPDPYVILEIPRSATDTEIRAAYLALVSRYHPDRHEGNPLADLASAKLAEVNRAYEILSDPARRAAWDATSGAPGVPLGAAARAAQGKFFGRAVIVIVGLALALRFGPLVLRGLVGLLRETAAVVRGTPLAVVPVLVVVVVLARVLRRPRPGDRTRSTGAKSRPHS
jgi:curved DNA-binding protein CbpA